MGIDTRLVSRLFAHGTEGHRERLRSLRLNVGQKHQLVSPPVAVHIVQLAGNLPPVNSYDSLSDKPVHTLHLMQVYHHRLVIFCLRPVVGHSYCEALCLSRQHYGYCSPQKNHQSLHCQSLFSVDKSTAFLIIYACQSISKKCQSISKV